MLEVKLPVFDESTTVADAFNQAAAARRSGIVVVGKNNTVPLVVDMGMLRYADKHKKLGEINFPYIDLSSKNAMGVVPNVVIESGTASILGLDDVASDRLNLAVTWYTCSSIPMHTYSPQEYRLLSTKDNVRICDVDQSEVK